MSAHPNALLKMPRALDPNHGRTGHTNSKCTCARAGRRDFEERPRHSPNTKDSGMKVMSIIGIGLAGVVALAACGQTARRTNGGQAQQDVVDASGNLRVPTDYPTRYQFLGTWVV